MSHGVFQKLTALATAFALIVSPLVLPASSASAAAPNKGDQPVWCQFTSAWVAQIGGGNKHRGALTKIPANASPKLYIATNPDTGLDQVYATDGSDPVLKAALAQYCQAQYAPEITVNATVCDDLRTTTHEGTISVSILNVDDLSNKAATYTITIDGVIKESVSIADAASSTLTYNGYAAGTYTVVVTDTEGNTLSYTATVTDCTLTTVTVTPPTTNDPCNDFGQVNPPVWSSTPTNGTGYTWAHNVDGSYTVTATTGYLLDIVVGGITVATGVANYTVSLPADNPAKVCYQTIEAPAMPTVAYTCGPVSTAAWILPDTTDTNWTWETDDEGDLWAHADKGYVFTIDGELTTSAYYGMASEYVTYVACPMTAPTYDDMACELNDTTSYTIPESDYYYYTVQVGDGLEVGMEPGVYNIGRANQTITIRAYSLADEALASTWEHTYKIPVCPVGQGNLKPEEPTAPVVQELPRTGGKDQNLTLTGLAVALATYGAVYFIQRKRA